MAMRYDGHPDQLYGPTTYSQNGEDLAIVNLFDLMGVKHPTYLDIGAHHPIHISNTYLLYTRGSRGVAVDANPNVPVLWKGYRHGDKFICKGVGSWRGQFDYFFIDDISGRNSFSETEVKKFLNAHPQFSVKRTEKIEVVTLDDIKAEAGLQAWPHFLTIDAEGLDLDILRSATFTMSDCPLVICAEVRLGKDESDFMYELGRTGYVPWARFGGNVIYVQPRRIGLFTGWAGVEGYDE